jgi:glycosyltransferase involved in cell wall biosynthesis
MSSKLFLSVALATDNGERYLAKQLDSISRQTRLPDELVISDDSSVDATLDIIRDFSRHAPFPIKLHINKTRLGTTRNFDKAIRACSGDIIFLCDQDDVWYQNKISLSEKCFINKPETGIVFSDADVVDQDLHPYGTRLWKYRRFNLREQRLVSDQRADVVLLRHFLVTGATMSFRSGYLDIVLPIPEACLHDAWIALIISATSNLTLISTPQIAYRQHSANQFGAFRRRRRDKSKDYYVEKFTQQALLYKMAQARLLKFSDSIQSKGMLEYHLGEKVNYLYARAALPDNWHRIPYVLRELIMLRYHRYGRGLKTFISDLFRQRV